MSLSLIHIYIGEVVAVVLHILLQVIQRTVAHRGSLIGALVVLQVIGGQNIDGLVVHSQLLLVGVVQGEAAGANGLHGVEVIVDTIVGVSLPDAIGVGADVGHGGDDAVAVGGLNADVYKRQVFMCLPNVYQGNFLGVISGIFPLISPFL